MYLDPCTPPYALSLSGNFCVNIMIDIDNCGSPGHKCASNYTSCSAGVCSAAPSVQVKKSNIIWTSAINGSVDDRYFAVTLPFNITLYTTTTAFVYVTTNGVNFAMLSKSNEGEKNRFLNVIT